MHLNLIYIPGRFGGPGSVTSDLSSLSSSEMVALLRAAAASSTGTTSTGARGRLDTLPAKHNARIARASKK